MYLACVPLARIKIHIAAIHARIASYIVRVWSRRNVEYDLSLRYVNVLRFAKCDPDWRILRRRKEDIAIINRIFSCHWFLREWDDFYLLFMKRDMNL